jgi:hypothetical protein
MKFRKGSVFVGAALGLVLLSSQANAHWCDDLWSSSYNIVVKPESDTVAAGSPMNIYVQNNMGYQLPNFKLSASVSGTALTVTAPASFKSGTTLLPGEKGTWKISGASLTKIDDVSFSVSFGNSGESKCYPTKGANAVMIVKTDGTLHPVPPALPGLDSPANPGCVGDMAQGRSLQYQAMADFEDANTGLDKLMTLYCAGRASFGSTDGVSQQYCKTTTSIDTCPTTKPTSGSGSKYDYMHLWAAGELAARKSVLGDRAKALRARLQCGVNDADVGFAGYALFMLGYLGDDDTAKAFIQTQVTAGGDLGTIGKAALYLMGDTSQKADVKTGAQSGSSTFVKVACAAALGIVDKDDSTITGTLIPLVKWTEPDTSDDGKGMFAAHLLALVAWDRRGWVANGGDKGPVSFYGDTSTPSGGNGGGTAGAGAGGVAGPGGGTGSGGAVGPGGSSGNKDAGSNDAKQGTGGAGVAGATGNGGSTSSTTGKGGALGSGGVTGAGSGGVVGPGGSKTSGSGGDSAGGTPSSNGGVTSGGAEAMGGSTGTDPPAAGGWKCNLGGPAHGSTLSIFALAGLAFAAIRRRRR